MNNEIVFRQEQYVDRVPTDVECILVGDIGGTNCNFGLFTVTSAEQMMHNPTLILSLHYKSAQVTNFTDLVVALLGYIKKQYRITVRRSCFAAAGVVSAARDYCKPTNLSFVLDSKDIMARTGLTCAVIVNDFEVIGHGISQLAPDQLVTINAGHQRLRANKVVLGAGTGLGKCILVWNSTHARYLPLASEGGHADFAAQTHLEFDLITYIKKSENRTWNVSWEDLLSGNGIQRIYAFFRQRNSSLASNEELAKNGLHPDTIFNSRFLDDHSRKTFDLYAHIYARCAKNFALDALALGGVYIAGGIAAKNIKLFEEAMFMQEFVSCGKQHDLLAAIPVSVIADYNVSLYGAALYMTLEGLCS